MKLKCEIYECFPSNSSLIQLSGGRQSNIEWPQIIRINSINYIILRKPKKINCLLIIRSKGYKDFRLQRRNKFESNKTVWLRAPYLLLLGDTLSMYSIPQELCNTAALLSNCVGTKWRKIIALITVTHYALEWCLAWNHFKYRLGVKMCLTKTVNQL